MINEPQFVTDYIRRMNDEKEDLNKKMEKIIDFIEGKIFQSLNPIEKELMMMQLSSMETYARCLRLRIFLAEKVEINVMKSN